MTIDLDQLKSDPDQYRDKCVRIRLKEGELIDFEVDCLQRSLGAQPGRPCDRRCGDCAASAKDDWSTRRAAA